MRKNIWGFAKAVASEGMSMVTPRHDDDHEDDAEPQDIADLDQSTSAADREAPATGAQQPEPAQSIAPFPAAETTTSQPVVAATPQPQVRSRPRTPSDASHHGSSVASGAGAGSASKPFPGLYRGGELTPRTGSQSSLAGSGTHPTPQQPHQQPTTTNIAEHPQYTALLARNQDLEKQVQVLKVDNNDIRNKTAQYAEDVKKNHEQTVQWYGAQAQKTAADQEKKVENLQRVHEEELEQANTSMALMLKEANGSIVQATQEKDKLAKEVDALKGKLAGVTAPPPAIAAGVTEEEVASKVLAAENAIRDALRQEHAATLDQLRHSVRSEAQEEAAKTLDSQMQQLRSQLEAQHQAELTAASLKATTSLQEELTQRHQAEVQQLQHSLNVANTSGSGKVQSLEGEIQRIKAATNATQIELESAHNEKVQALTTSSEQSGQRAQEAEHRYQLLAVEVDQLRASGQRRKETCEQEVLALQEQLRIAQETATNNAPAVSATGSEVDWDGFAEEQCGEETNKAESAKAASPPSSVSQTRISQLEAELTQIKSKVATLEAERDSAEVQLTEAKKQHLMATQKLTSESEQAASESEKQWNDRLKQTTAKLEDTHAQEVFTLNQAITGANDKSSALQQEVEQLQRTISSETEHNIKLQTDLKAAAVANMTAVEEERSRAASQQQSSSGALEAQMRQNAEQHQQNVAQLQAEHQAALSSLNAKLTAVEESKTELGKAQETIASLQEALNSALEAKSILQQRITTSESDLNSTRTQLSQVLERSRQLEQSLESERNGKASNAAMAQHTEATIKTLTTTRDEIQEELRRVRELDQEALALVSTTLFKMPNLQPRSPTSPSPKTQPKTVVEGVTALAEGIQQLTAAHQEHEGLLRQWAQTYEQAKGVNADMSAKLQEASKQMAALREELSLKDMSLSRSTQRSAEEGGRLHELEVLLAQSRRDLEVLTEERTGLEHELRKRNAEAENAQSSGQEYETTVMRLTAELQAKEGEMTEAREANENLQQVLENFKRDKEQDVVDRTQYLTHEIDAMKAQVAALQAQQAAKDDNLEGIQQQYQRDLASKNLTIRGFQNRINELRRAIEEAAEKLDEDNKIDKRIVSSLLVNYIHSSVAQRGDLDDQVRVMAGLLSWEDEHMEKAGLIPGPQNPRPAASGGWGSALWGGGGAVAANNSAGGPGKQGAAPPPGRLAKAAGMWVDYLMQVSGDLESAAADVEAAVADSGAQGGGKDAAAPPQ